MNVYADPAVMWLRRAYWDEYPLNIDRVTETPLIPFERWVERVLDDRYMAWATQRVPDAHGRLVAARDDHGRVVRSLPEREADRWLLPAHEAVKRLRGRRRGPYRPEYYWLRSVILWRGLPCACSHPGVVEHVAEVWRTSPRRVASGVVRMSRAAARLVGLDRDRTVPGVALPPAGAYNDTSATRKRRSQRVRNAPPARGRGRGAAAVKQRAARVAV